MPLHNAALASTQGKKTVICFWLFQTERKKTTTLKRIRKRIWATHSGLSGRMKNKNPLYNFNHLFHNYPFFFSSSLWCFVSVRSNFSNVSTGFQLVDIDFPLITTINDTNDTSKFSDEPNKKKRGYWTGYFLSTWLHFDLCDAFSSTLCVCTCALHRTLFVLFMWTEQNRT